MGGWLAGWVDVRLVWLVSHQNNNKIVAVVVVAVVEVVVVVIAASIAAASKSIPMGLHEGNFVRYEAPVLTTKQEFEY